MSRWVTACFCGWRRSQGTGQSAAPDEDGRGGPPSSSGGEGHVASDGDDRAALDGDGRAAFDDHSPAPSTGLSCAVPASAVVLPPLKASLSPFRSATSASSTKLSGLPATAFAEGRQTSGSAEVGRQASSSTKGESIGGRGSDCIGEEADVIGVDGGLRHAVAAFKVVYYCSQSTSLRHRGSILHVCLGRNMYFRFGRSQAEAPGSLEEFRNLVTHCVCLERGRSQLRSATSADMVAVREKVSDRLLFVQGIERNSESSWKDLRTLTMVLEALSADVVTSWVEIGSSMLRPWPLLLLSSGDRGDSKAPMCSMLSSVPLACIAVPSNAEALVALEARGRCSPLEASIILQYSLAAKATTASKLKSCAQRVVSKSEVSQVPLGLRVALLSEQAGALTKLSYEHATISVETAKRCQEVLGLLLGHVAEKLKGGHSNLAEANTEQLYELLERLEGMLNSVELTSFSPANMSVLLDSAVRQWEKTLDILSDELSVLREPRELLYRFVHVMEDTAANGSAFSRRALPNFDVREYAGPFDVRAPDAIHVRGVDNPKRAEHAIVCALKRYVAGEGVDAPRVGVCAIGGSGKSTACAGVATCDYARGRFRRGTSWVQLGAGSTRQTLHAAVVALTYRFRGEEAARRILSLKPSDNFVGVAAEYMQSVRWAEATEWLVVVDDVLDSNVNLLLQLLRVVPRVTPILFTTRSEAVSRGLTGSQLVRLDELPGDDARLVLARAFGRTVRPGMPPFSDEEEALWVQQVIEKTHRHALSLVVVGSMMQSSRMPWQRVLAKLERGLVPESISGSDTFMDSALSLRKTLDMSTSLLPNKESRSAFAALGVLPANVEVGLHVLVRLWRNLVDVSGDGGITPPSGGDGRGGNAAALYAVDALVDNLVRAGLLARRLDPSSGMITRVVVHPVVRGYARSLLADAYEATHLRLVKDYMAELPDGGVRKVGWRVYEFWNSHDDGYWYDNAARHVAAGGDVAGLRCLIVEAWRAKRVLTSSMQAYQQDVEIVLASLLTVIDDSQEIEKWTSTQPAAVYNSIADAYRVRDCGRTVSNTEAAVRYYRRALALVARTDAPARWATLQSSLGTTYWERVARDRDYNVEEAIACFHRALEVWRRELAPFKWATTQLKLGPAYLNRVLGDKAANVEMAVQCYLQALKVWTREAGSEEWARAQVNLGIAYSSRVVGNDADNMEMAVQCYRRALEVLTLKAAPQSWAAVHATLGTAHRYRVAGERAENVDAAVRYYRQALKVWTQEAAPLDWASTQMNLGLAHSERVTGDKAANVEVAITSFRRALEVWTQEGAPRDWATTQLNLGASHSERLAGDKAGDIEVAITCFLQALKVWTLEAAPTEWAMTQVNLGAAYINRVVGDRANNVELATARFLLALEVWTRERAPEDWARTQINLTIAYIGRMVGDEEDNVEAAVECYRRALNVPAVRLATGAPPVQSKGPWCPGSRGNFMQAMMQLKVALQTKKMELEKHERGLAKHLIRGSISTLMGEVDEWFSSKQEKRSHVLHQQGSCSEHLIETSKEASLNGDAVLLHEFAALETQKLERLRVRSLSTALSPDQALRLYCFRLSSQATDELGVTDSMPVLPELPALWLSGLRSPPIAVQVELGAETHHAFAAAVAAHAGSEISTAWLRSIFGPAAGFTFEGHVSAAQVSSIILRSGQTLYVSSAGKLQETWASWVSFLAAPAEGVHATSLPQLEAGPAMGLPDHFAVNRGALAAARANRAVLNTLHDAVERRREADDAVTGIVFCGHGRGGAVAQILALHLALSRPPGEEFEALVSSMTTVTFGCPSVGDAAFQEYVLDLTGHRRLYVEHDPVAGLPSFLCVGLRFSPSVRQYAASEAREHWALSPDGRARAGSGVMPRVPSLAVAGLSFKVYHSLHAYAACLCSLYEASR